MLYDNLEFDNQQQRANDYKETRIDSNTVLDQYDINYRWNDENLGREINTSLNSILDGLNSLTS